jgi:hypothetical protein
LFGEKLELFSVDHKNENITNLHDGIHCLVHHIFNKQLDNKKVNKIAKYLIRNKLLLKINLDFYDSNYYWISFSTLNKIYNFVINASFDFNGQFDLNNFVQKNGNYRLITLKEININKKIIDINEEDKKHLRKLCSKLGI